MLTCIARAFRDCRGQQRALDPLKLALFTIGSNLKKMLGIKLRVSARELVFPTAVLSLQP